MPVPAPTRPHAPAGGPRTIWIVAGFAAVALVIGCAVLLTLGDAKRSVGAVGVPTHDPAPAVTEGPASEDPANEDPVHEEPVQGESGAITVREVPAPEGSPAALAEFGGDAIETPCFTFEAPMLLRNVSSAQETAACTVDALATARATLDGQTSESLWGEVTVTSVVLDGGPAPDSRTAFDAVWATYAADFAHLPDASPEAMSLDGAPAEITRFPSADGALDIAVLAAYPPHPYPVDGQEAQLVVIMLGAQSGSGDDYVRQVRDTWQWN